MSLPFTTLTSSKPGFTSNVMRMAEGALRWLTALVKALVHRREVNRLLELDDRALKDIGLVRSDVQGALAEPFGQDPSIVLRLRSVDNRARQRAVQDAARRVTRTELCR